MSFLSIVESEIDAISVRFQIGEFVLARGQTSVRIATIATGTALGSKLFCLAIYQAFSRRKFRESFLVILLGSNRAETIEPT